MITLSTVLRIRRMLDGDEIDPLISDVQARKALAIERARRKQWQRTGENAAKFTASVGTEQINLSGPEPAASARPAQSGSATPGRFAARRRRVRCP